MSDAELIARWDDYVESMGSVMGEVEHIAQQMRERIEVLIAERDKAIAKVDFYEQNDQMDGAVVHVIRELLYYHNVPKTAFIDDHVANAIVQRNIAESKLAKAVEALDYCINAPFSGWTIAQGYARSKLEEIKGE